MLVEPIPSIVAEPILESVSRGAFVGVLLAPPNLNISANPPPLFDVDSFDLLDNSFNSLSNASKSFTSTFVLRDPERSLSFINNSIPGPKFTEGPESEDLTCSWSCN